MVSVHSSFCVLSEIHIVVSVHLRTFLKFYGMGCVFNLVPILWVGSGPGHRGPHSTYASLSICCLGPVEAAPRLNSPCGKGAR